MSGGEAEPEAIEEAEPVGEPRQMSERTAKVVLLAVTLGAIWGIVRVAPYVAYFVAGILACRGWEKARGWIGRRRGSDEDDDPEADEVDVVEALRYLARGGRNVLLTELRDELGVADTKAVKALLDEAGVRWREGVRTPAGNGPGVHQTDVPPLPSPTSESQEGRCWPRSEPTPTPTTEPIGLAGVVVKDGSEAGRRHTVR